MTTKSSYETVKLYLNISKPRIALMVLITTTIGYFLALGTLPRSGEILFTLFGTFLLCSGSAALNNFLERDIDKLMKRTRNRPIPSGAISPASALSYGTTLVMLGTIVLAYEVNLLTALLGLMSAFLYVLVYTPLKRITWMNTLVGAVPGALPPVGGWAAATGEIGLGAWVLFAILFFWQLPHFYSIAWLYRKDYQQAGFKMLPSLDPSGVRTNRQVMLSCLILVPVSLAPFFLGLAGETYAFGSLVVSVLFLIAGIRFVRQQQVETARALLQFSILYLPLILLLVVSDARFV